MDFDPKVVSFDDLLCLYWENHRPTHPMWSRQYRSAVFYHGEEQRQAAVDSKERIERELGVPLYVDIEPAREFWLAEGYHQKYYLRGDRTLASEFKSMYPRDADFIASTAAARVNGFVAGYGDVQRDIDRLGLSDAARQELLGRAQRRRRFTCQV